MSYFPSLKVNNTNTEGKRKVAFVTVQHHLLKVITISCICISDKKSLIKKNLYSLLRNNSIWDEAVQRSLEYYKIISQLPFRVLLCKLTLTPVAN